MLHITDTRICLELNGSLLKFWLSYVATQSSRVEKQPKHGSYARSKYIILARMELESDFGSRVDTFKWRGNQRNETIMVCVIYAPAQHAGRFQILLKVNEQ